MFVVADAKEIAKHLQDRWNNVGVVAALCATMAISMDVLPTDQPSAPTELFAAVTGISFVLSLASVLVALVLFVQVNNLFREEDIKWFIQTTQAYHFLPSRLLMLAIASLVIGHSTMIFMLHETPAGTVVGFASVVMLGYCYWFYESMRQKVDQRLCQLVSNVEELRMVFRMIDTKNQKKVTVERMRAQLRDKVIQNYIQARLCIERR